MKMPFKFVNHLSNILTLNSKTSKGNVEEKHGQLQSSTTQAISIIPMHTAPLLQSVAFSTNNSLDCYDDHMLPRMVVFSVYGEPPPPPSLPSSFSLDSTPPPPPPSTHSLSQSSSLYLPSQQPLCPPPSVCSISTSPSPPPPSLYSAF